MDKSTDTDYSGLCRQIRSWEGEQPLLSACGGSITPETFIIGAPRMNAAYWERYARYQQIMDELWIWFNQVRQ